MTEGKQDDGLRKLEITKNEAHQRRLKNLTEKQTEKLGKQVKLYNVLVENTKQMKAPEKEKLKTLQEAFDVIWSEFRYCVNFMGDISECCGDDKNSPLLNPECAGDIKEKTKKKAK